MSSSVSDAQRADIDVVYGVDSDKFISDIYSEVRSVSNVTVYFTS